MEESRGINFFIHDLHPYGGQDRSTLEILNQLSQRMPVHVYAYHLHNPEHPDSGIQFHRCPLPWLRRPVLLKSIWFQAWSLWVKLTSPRRLTFSTGVCSLYSDIVHVQFVANAWRSQKGKLMVKRSGLSKLYHQILAFYNERLERKLFRGARSFAAISESVANDLRAHFSVEAPRIALIRHGVDIEKFRPAADLEERASLRRELALPNERPILLFVGAYDRKGLATLVRAATQLRQSRPDLCVVAVGQGDAFAYRELAGEGSDSWLLLRSPSKEIEKYFRAADAFVLPTLYEPFGLVILEGMSAGLPVVVSRSAGASELIQTGENGWLLEDPADPTELRLALTTLLNSPDLRLRLGREARQTALQCSWEAVAGEFTRLIESERARRGLQ